MSGGFDSMSGFGQGVDPFGDTAPLSSSTTQPPPPPSSGSNRDSLNLDDFEKVEADDHLFGGPPSTVSSTIGNVAESTQAAAVGLVDDIMAKVTSSGEDLFSSFTATGLPSASETKAESSTKSDPFKLDDMDIDFGVKAPASSSDLISTSGGTAGGIGFDLGFTGIPSSESFTTDLLASAPPPPSNNLFDDLSPKPDEKPDMSAFDDFLSKADIKGELDSTSDLKGLSDFSIPDVKGLSDFSMPEVKGLSDFSMPEVKGLSDFSMPEVKETVKDVSEPLFESVSSFNVQAPFSGEEPVKRDPSPDFRNPTPPRTPTAPLQDIVPPKQPSPPRTPTPPREPTPPPKKEPTPPPREPSPPPKQPTPPRTPSPPPREPSPLPREPTPPPKEPTPPPKEPTPPPKEPTPPPKEPTPPPREPTPPPREPTPPPREPTPPPREPTPPPKVPTPPPREPTPPPREPTPPPREPSPVLRTPTPPPVLKKEVSPSPIQEAIVSPGKSYKVSASTEKAFNVFKPRAWFNPDQLDPRVVDLIYWRDVKKTGIVFGSLMVILLSLAYLSLISVVAYSSLAILTGTITFRVYKNIMQAVQKSQDGHPFKSILELDTDLPSDKVHEATDVIVAQINSTVSELKRLFLVEDLVDSVKFGCLLWCLTYLGSWFNGLTLVILAVVALFSLPKVYEQNQAQIDQYVGLVRSQVNDVMSKVKAALPIGNKEKSQ